MDVRSSLGVAPNLGPMDFLGLGAPRPPAAAAVASPTTPTTASGHPAAPSMSQREINHVAEGFDAMFASLLIKQMRQSLDSGGMFGQDSGDVLGGLFDTFMGDHLGKAGGLGIGAMVKKQLEQVTARRAYSAQALATQSARNAPGPRTGNGPRT